MKKIVTLALGAALSCAACAKAPQAPAQTAKPWEGKKILVAYYSRSGNTSAVARQIAQRTGADLYEIQTVKTYPSAYREMTEVAKEEIKNGFLPELKGTLPDTADYDAVFVGSPDWWSTYAPAVRSFLSKINLKGKTVVPFFTNGGGGMQNCESDMQKQLSGVRMAGGISFRGRSSGADEKELEAWLSTLEL